MVGQRTVDSQHCHEICGETFVTICWLVVTGTMEFYDFPYIGNGIIIPTDEIIFFRGVGIPPTRYGFGHVFSTVISGT